METIIKKPAIMAGELTEALKYQAFVKASCEKYLLRYPATGQPITAIVAGMISRESAWGLKLVPRGPGGTGDFHKRPLDRKVGNGEKADYELPPVPSDMQSGFGRGFFQIDYDWWIFAVYGEWEKADKNIDFGCSILRKYLDQLIRNRFDEDLLFQAMVASYNCGPRNVLKSIEEGNGIDGRTTGHNYSADVFARAECFRKQLQGWI